MKIALLSDCYLPRLGGIEVQVHDMATRLADRGHEVDVFTATQGPHGEKHGVVEVIGEPGSAIRVHRMAISLPWQLPVNPLAPPALRERLRGFDVAHVHMGVVSPFAVDCARVTTGLGLPTAMTWHCVLDRFAPVVRGLRVVHRWAEGGMAMSGVSRVAAAPLRPIVSPSPVAVLPNGIDVAQWAPIPGREQAHPGRAGEPVRIVSAMRLAARKRAIPLLRAMIRVRELVPADRPLTLEIFGEGPDRKALERLIDEHDLRGWVQLPGRVARESLRERYAGADLYVSPTVLESFGIAPLEARTVGLPVVARTGSGVSEFVTDGVNGFLAADDEELAVALARLVMDDDLRASMRQHNETTTPAQDWDDVLDIAESEYRRAIEATGR